MHEPQLEAALESESQKVSNEAPKLRDTGVSSSALRSALKSSLKAKPKKDLAPKLNFPRASSFPKPAAPTPSKPAAKPVIGLQKIRTPFSEVQDSAEKGEGNPLKGITSPFSEASSETLQHSGSLEGAGLKKPARRTTVSFAEPRRSSKLLSNQGAQASQGSDVHYDVEEGDDDIEEMDENLSDYDEKEMIAQLTKSGWTSSSTAVPSSVFA